MKNLKPILIILPLLLAACTGQNAAEPTPIPVATEAALAPTQTPPTETAVPPTIPIDPTPTEAISTVSTEEAPATLVAEPIMTETAAAPTATPDPAQALISSFAGPSETTGQSLILVGQVLDVNGDPVPDARVEIWQTDFNGVYDHPGDPSTENRDRSFQFFGSYTTGSDGWYVFRTLVPGQYEPRPRHIHFKVIKEEYAMLTSQFYFSEDIAEIEGEGIFRQAGINGDLLLLQLVQGDGTLLANGQIVVDLGIGPGVNQITPAQAEGPYYPVVPVIDYDNDLVVLP